MYHKIKEAEALYICMSSVTEKLDEYLSSLSPLLKVTFFADERSYKKAYANYRRICASILKLKDSADATNADLSLLICSADKEMNISALKLYSEIFESYCSWANSMSIFLSNSEKEFKASNRELKLSALITHANIFINQTTTFKNFLESSISIKI